jgi:HPt (histidine-containing phosphotransfer) domain-containing protein
MPNRRAAIQDASGQRALSCSRHIPAFDATEFYELTDMIGDEGVMEMVMIFEAETRSRVQRLESGNQDLNTQLREMHTLKGAAATVGAPRLAALGRAYEHAARAGTAPTPEDAIRIAEALEVYLSAMRDWTTRRTSMS